MLKKLLEKSCGQISESKFALILELTSLDIKVNRIGYGQKTSLSEAVTIAERCHTLIQR